MLDKLRPFGQGIFAYSCLVSYLDGDLKRECGFKMQVALCGVDSGEVLIVIGELLWWP